MIFEFIGFFVVYLIIIYVAYYVTEIKRLPEWLQFPPMNCRKCLSAWSVLGVSLVIGISFGLYAFLITGIIMAILTGISMHIYEKNKTIKISDFE